MGREVSRVEEQLTRSIESDTDTQQRTRNTQGSSANERRGSFGELTEFHSRRMLNGG